jgi:phosphonate transport system ATP-binding protein
MLSLEGVTKDFGPVRAVDDVSLSIAPGEMVAVIGPSGAGKSTLLRLINRLAAPTAGQVAWKGQPVSTLNGAALRQWRARCAMVFQQFNLSPRLDVLTNVLVGGLSRRPGLGRLFKMFPAEERARAVLELHGLGLAEAALKRACCLSGGQQQRVAIARALMQDPELILADEPIASLDPANAEIVMDTLAAINRERGITVLVNLHALDVARRYCRRIIGMANGRVVFDGPPEALNAAVTDALYGRKLAPAMPVPDAAAAFAPEPLSAFG